MSELVGTTLGHYRIEALLGKGNRAAVYRATDSRTDRGVALRVFDPDLSADPAFAARLRRVLPAVMELRHPHLLPLEDFGLEGGRAYLARPFVAGGTLRDRLGTALDPVDAWRLLRPIAAALDLAHRRGLAHGDLKPGSILLQSGAHPLLADLGAAQLLPRGNSLLLVSRGHHYGTPEYLAPEQSHALTVDSRTDVYALGVILYEALTGRPPFRTEPGVESPRAIAMRHTMTMPLSPRALNPALGEELERALLRALAKDPDRRFPTAGDLLDALDAALAPAESPARTAWLPAGDEAITVDAPRGTWLLPQDEPKPDATEALRMQDEERDREELRALRESYEARLAAQIEEAASKDAEIAQLRRRLAQAQERQESLSARLREHERLVRERDELAARVRELEEARELALRSLVQGPSAAAAPATAGGAAPPPARLVVLDHERVDLPAQTSFTLHTDTLVGRRANADISLRDNFVSGGHARLTREADGWWVTDLGTLNGTFVNGARIDAPTLLRPDDEVRFGRVRTRFVPTGTAMPEPAGRAERASAAPAHPVSARQAPALHAGR